MKIWTKNDANAEVIDMSKSMRTVLNTTKRRNFLVVERYNEDGLTIASIV